MLQIREEREVEETVEARTFGEIVHGTLEDLYEIPRSKNKILTESIRQYFFDYIFSVSK